MGKGSFICWMATLIKKNNVKSYKMEKKRSNIARLLLLILAPFLLFGLICNGQKTLSEGDYTLQQCVEMAIRNNPLVKQSEFTMLNDRVNLEGAIGNMLPSVNGFFSRSIFNGKSINPFTNAYINQGNTADNYQITGSIVLWNGFSIYNYIRQSSLAYQAGKMDWQQTRDQTAITVILDYLAVLNLQEQLDNALSQASVNKEQTDRLTTLNNQGAIAPSDLYNEKGQLNSSLIQVLNTRNALLTAKLTLSQEMNIPFDTAMQLEPLKISSMILYSDSVDRIYQYALKNLPFVRAAKLHEESAKEGLKSARGQLFPVISLNGGLATNYSSVASSQELISTSDELTSNYVMINNAKDPVYGPVSNYNSLMIPYQKQINNNFNSYIGLTLQIPIINRLQARGKVAQAKITEDQSEFQLKTAKIQLKQAIEQDYLNMTNAYSSYLNLEDQVKDYAESFREAGVKFNAGSINSVDYITVENLLNQARLNLIAAKYNYILDNRIMDYYQGRLGISTSGTD